jgi:hypothetical protein
VDTQQEVPDPTHLLRDSLSESIRKDLKLSLQGTAGDVLQQLGLVEEIDRENEPLARKWSTICIVAGILCVVSIPLIFLAGLGLILLVPSLILLVFGWLKYNKFSRLDLYDRRHEIPARLITYLSADMAPDAPLAVTIDFNSYHNKRYKTGQVSEGWSVKKYQYELPWFTIRGQLVDGSKFRMKITQDVKRKEKRKRKSTKVTETSREKLNLLIAVKPTRYPQVANFPRLMSQAQPPAQLQVAQTKVNGNRILLQALTAPERTSTPSGADIHGVLQMFLASYDCLAQCR